MLWINFKIIPMSDLNISKEKLEEYSGYKNPNTAFVYEMPPGLSDAIEVAISLNQPLLITGEPGTGKTSLAEKVAFELSHITGGKFRKEPYRFNTKSSSIFSDLFYTYDAMSHFYNANVKKDDNLQIKDFIELNALGIAIVASMNSDERMKIPARNIPSNPEPISSVVLIDEIDKAPREFPNDLLNELENFCFTIKEAGAKQYQKSENSKIIVILTSNNEKDFPEPFLRRCIYFNIDFPSNDLLRKILEKHLLLRSLYGKEELILEYFSDLRNICQYKKPSTAELIAWCKVIAQKRTDLYDKKAILETLPAIIKHRDDLDIVSEYFNKSLS